MKFYISPLKSICKIQFVCSFVVILQESTEQTDIQTETEWKERSGTAGSFGNVSTNGPKNRRSQSGPSATRSWRFVKDTYINQSDCYYYDN